MDPLKALPRVQKLYAAAGGLAVFLVALLLFDWAGPVKATDLNTWWIPFVLAVVAGGYVVSEIWVHLADLRSERIVHSVRPSWCSSGR